MQEATRARGTALCAGGAASFAQGGPGDSRMVGVSTLFQPLPPADEAARDMDDWAVVARPAPAWTAGAGARSSRAPDCHSTYMSLP